MDLSTEKSKDGGNKIHTDSYMVPKYDTYVSRTYQAISWQRTRYMCYRRGYVELYGYDYGRGLCIQECLFIKKSHN